MQYLIMKYNYQKHLIEDDDGSLVAALAPTVKATTAIEMIGTLEDSPGLHDRIEEVKKELAEAEDHIKYLEELAREMDDIIRKMEEFIKDIEDKSNNFLEMWSTEATGIFDKLDEII